MLETRRPKKKTAGSYHHGDLRRALIDATLAIIKREGTGAVSLSAAARHVGVSPQATYSHFRDKAELLAAAAGQAMHMLDQAVCAARDAEVSPGTRLEATGIAYVRFACEHSALFRLLSTPELAHGRHPLLQAAYESAFGTLLSAGEDSQRAGLVRQGDARALAVAAWSTVHGTARLAVDGLLEIAHAGDDPFDITRASLRMLFKGIRAK